MTTSDSRIKVLVIEDSPTVQMLLVDAIDRSRRLRTIGAVGSAEDALEFLAHEKPDVILMDIHLPGMNGFEATRHIMHHHPLPIVICSAVADPNDVATTFEAVEAGALAVLAKPVAPSSPCYAAAMERLVETLALMAEVKVIRRWNRGRSKLPALGPVTTTTPAPSSNGGARIVAIGTSTGGPPVLRTIFSNLPHDFPLPIAVVQHIAPGFLYGLVEWLAESSQLPLHIARHGERALPGHVYFAPDSYHLGMSAPGRFALADGMSAHGLCPSVSHLYRSVLDHYGPEAVAVLLTGMGKDGARELALLKQRGATTIAQDKHTSVVHGMPGEAIRLQGATYVLPADEIAPALNRLLTQA